MKLLSFNIRCTNDPDGHSIPERAPRVAAIVREEAPDIAGFQEYHRRWDESWPVVEHPDYESWKVDRGDGEGLVLMWRRDGLRLLEKGYFWFGDDPTVPSTDWDEKYHKNRICAWLVLEDRKTGTVFTYMNVHYGFGDAGQVKSAALLQSYAQKLGHPTVIAGDFNMQPEAAGYVAMTQRFADVNMATAKLRDITYHDYGRSPGKILDYCFISDGITPKSFRILTQTFNTKYPSDHYPIAIELEI